MEATATMPAHAPVIQENEDRSQAACRIANEMFARTPDWVVFFREVLGVNGLVRKIFTSAEDLAAFEKTAEYAEIQKMVKRLRGTNGAASEAKENTRVITVRLPASLHESLKAEAHDRKTSINQLCISKLLQVMEEGEEEAA